jgi:hypothetical protein
VELQVPTCVHSDVAESTESFDLMRRRIKVMAEPRRDAPEPKQDESSEARSVENTMQIEGLLDFSFVEEVFQRVVINGARAGLSCS